MNQNSNTKTSQNHAPADLAESKTKEKRINAENLPQDVQDVLAQNEPGIPAGAKHLSPPDAGASRYSKKHKAFQYLQTIFGSVIFAIGVTLFISPWKFNTGGLIGIAQIVSLLLTHSNALTGIINITLNIPLFILAWKSLSKGFIVKTLLSIVTQSMLLSALPVPAEPIFADPLTNVLFGAIICGVGIGLCLQSAGSAGGLDILGVYFSISRPGFSVGKISYIVNAFVEAFAILVFGVENALYSTLFLVLMYFVSDQVHLQNISVSGMIITTNPELKNILLTRIRRGITWWPATGAYTGQEKEVLLCVMNRYEVRYVKKLVHHADPKAFLLLTKGKAVLGNFERRLMD